MALEEIGLFDFLWPALSLVLLVRWFIRIEYGKRCFAHTAQNHLQLQVLEFLVVMVVAFFSMWIGEYQSATQAETAWQWQDMILAALFVGLWFGPIILLTGKFQFLLSAGRFGFTRRGWVACVFRAIGYFIVAYGLTGLTLFATLFICAWMGNNEVPVHDTLKKLQDSPTARQMVLLAVLPILVAPLLEELIFRGLIQTLLIRIISHFQKTAKDPSGLPICSVSSRWFGIVIAAMLFSTYHANWQHWPALFVLAVCMGYSYEKEDNLFVPILIHSLFNLLIILLVLREAPAFH